MFSGSYSSSFCLLSFLPFLSIFLDVRLLSVTAIEGWKSQHWFIWRVLSSSGPFQALTLIQDLERFVLTWFV